MVKKLLRYIFWLLLPLGLFAASALWLLLGTAGGAIWLLDNLSRWTPVEIRSEQTSGRLADSLQLEQVQVRWPGGTAHLDRVQFRWQPGRLFRGQLKIEELILEGTDIELRPPPSGPAQPAVPVGFAWPRGSGLPIRLSGQIASLQFTQLHVHKADAAGLIVERVRARLSWRGGLLSVEALELVTPAATVRGRGAAGFDIPQLQLELDVQAAQPLAGLESFSLRADLEPAPAPAQLSGTLELRGRSGRGTELSTSAQLVLAPDRIALKQGKLHRPGQRGEVAAEAEIVLGLPKPQLRLKARLADLDLVRELGQPTAISGTLDFSGTPNDYRGRFSLANRTSGALAGELSGEYAGSQKKLNLTKLSGRWLAGTLAGDLELRRTAGGLVQGRLQARDLDPGLAGYPWAAPLDLDLEGTLSLDKERTLAVSASAELRSPSLGSQPVTARLAASLAGEDLRVQEFQLQAEGLQLSAHGRLRDRLEFAAQALNLGALKLGIAGRFMARGWLRWRQRQLTGTLDARGHDLAFNEFRADDLRLAAQRRDPEQPFQVTLSLDEFATAAFHNGSAEVRAVGRPEQHRLQLRLRSTQVDAEVLLQGGYRKGQWQGTLARLEGQEQDLDAWTLAAPVALSLSRSRIKLGPLRLKGAKDATVQLEGDLALNPLRGALKARWHDFSLAHANPWLDKMTLLGKSSGTARARWDEAGALDLAGTLRLSGKLELEQAGLELEQAELELAWTRSGLNLELELQPASGGRLSGTLSAPESAVLRLPDRGRLDFAWSKLDPALFEPLLPPGLSLAGRLSGQLLGGWLPGMQLDLQGTTSLEEGRVEWRGKAGRIGTGVKRAELSGEWRGGRLSAELLVNLAEQGRIAGHFQLPLPARLPLRMNSEGPVQAQLQGRLGELGLLSALWPGLMQETQGQVETEMRIAGSWQSPQFDGQLALADAGAYLPVAGIRLSGIGLRAQLAGDRIEIEEFRVDSSPGQLQGEATIRLQGWDLSSYRATISGERFRLLYHPELQVLASPRLNIEGSRHQLKIRGDLLLPELLILRALDKPPVTNSPDLIIIDAAEAAADEPPVALDLELRVELGERVLLKVGGVDARLGGTVTLMANSPADVRAQGGIRVLEGHYAAYGMRLQIERGELFYAGSPVAQPILDIKALKTIGEVKAGVRVSGTPQIPQVSLYSEPSMADTDILSYMVLGRPLGADSGQANLLSIAAAGLLSKGESAVLQDRLKHSLGLDVVDIQAGNGDVAASVVTIGKYLNPRLYISFGYSVFADTNEYRLRYRISDKWELESLLGEVSGTDLYYKVEFQ